MKISAFLNQTLIDFPEKLSSVIFVSGCNFKCPACHAKHIIYGNKRFSEKEILSYLGERKGWLDGVVFCGGEPTLQEGLVDFVKKIKERGFEIKLDTNGYEPEVLKELLEQKTLDYVALDIKAPKSLYSIVAGVDVDTNKIEESMKIAADSGINYEFRTTVVPLLRNCKEINWMTQEEAVELAKWVVSSTGKNNHRYYLQKFVARNGREMVDEKFSKENLKKEFHETPYELMKEMKELVKGYLPNCEIRGDRDR